MFAIWRSLEHWLHGEPRRVLYLAVWSATLAPLLYAGLVIAAYETLFMQAGLGSSWCAQIVELQYEFVDTRLYQELVIVSLAVGVPVGIYGVPCLRISRRRTPEGGAGRDEDADIS